MCVLIPIAVNHQAQANNLSRKAVICIILVTKAPAVKFALVEGNMSKHGFWALIINWFQIWIEEKLISQLYILKCSIKAPAASFWKLINDPQLTFPFIQLYGALLPCAFKSFEDNLFLPESNQQLIAILQVSIQSYISAFLFWMKDSIQEEKIRNKYTKFLNWLYIAPVRLYVEIMLSYMD